MTCLELQDGYELYVCGTLEEPERSEIQTHLDRGCPTCTLGVGRAQRLAVHLALVVPQAEPPARLRGKILQNLATVLPAEPTLDWGAFWKWGFAVSAVVAVALAIVSVSVYQQARSAEGELLVLRDTTQSQRHREQDLLTQLSAYRQALRLMTMPGAREAHFGPQQPAGRVIVQPQGLVLIASGVPQLRRGRTYELWLFAANGPAPIPAGVFSPDASGQALHVWQERVDVGLLKAIAVSDEPLGGVKAPTGKILLNVPMR